MEIQFDRIPLVYYFARYKVPVVIQPIELLHFPIQFADTSKYVDTKVSINSNTLSSLYHSRKILILFLYINITLGI